MPAEEPSVQQQLALLKEAFGAKISERILEIENAAAPLTGDTLVEEEAMRAIDTLQALSHKLTGSAGTFGFGEISVAARNLEQYCGSRKDLMPTSGDCREILGLIVHLASVSNLREEEPDDAPVATGPIVEAEKNMQDPVVLYFGDSAVANGELKQRFSDFSLRIRHCDKSSLDRPDDCADVVAALVDLDSPEWADAEERELQEIGARYPTSIALAKEGPFERRLWVVRLGFESFFQKPFDTTAIVDLIDRRISERQPDPFRILIVDDDVELGKYVQVILGGAGMIVESISDPFETLDRIQKFCPELVLIDLNMPTCSGVELATIIRQQDTLSSISIVFLSSETDAARQIAAMHTGGDDFLPKSLRSEHLVSAIEARAKRFRQLRAMLVSDSLTGLLNHTATKHQMETEIARAKREDKNVCFVLIDIDHFKAVNDTHGHGLGDEVIRSLALLLKQRFRTTDVLGRLGGEEFGLVLTGVGRENALRIVNEVRVAFSEMVFKADSEDFSVTFSAGVSLYPDHSTVKELSDAADQALYSAKEAGRNQVVFAE